MGKDKHSKKSKKHKSKKKKRHHSSSSESSSGDEWVEKEPVVPAQSEKPKKERDGWMGMEAVFSGKTRSELNVDKKKDDEEKKKNILDEPGQSTRELNPFWKNGGTGLPSEENSSSSRLSSRVGDGGAEYMRKALQRAKEQAEEEGRPLDSVIAERWGSLSEFNQKLREAERARERKDHYHRRYDEKPSRDDSCESRYRRKEETSHYRNLKFKKPDMASEYNEKEPRSYQSSSSRKNWKKPGYEDKNKSELPSERITHSQSEKQEPKNSEETQKYEKIDSEDRVLTHNEMNQLVAAILRAEFADDMELANKLKIKHQRAKDRINEEKNKSSTGLSDEKGRNVRLLTETDNRGYSRPSKSSEGQSYSRKRSNKTNTHEGKERVRYFADDDKYSLQDMFEKEKFNSQAEQDFEFYKLMKKGDDEAAFDAARIDRQEKDDKRHRSDAIRKYEAREKALDNCRWCISSDKKSNNIVALKNKVYLAVPSFQSLTKNHCLIVPQHHVSCATLADEDVWDEIMDVRKTLVKIFEEDDEDIIFFESALYIDRHPHMILHCVPVPKEIGDTAPIYFKKAIMECETEWSNNKKVVELAGRNVRKAVPKGLPYFAVDFGMQSGYAHVIEDKKLFPHNFAQEIIGGMLDLEHTIWRKPKRDSEENIEKKVESLKQLVKDYI